MVSWGRALETERTAGAKALGGKYKGLVWGRGEASVRRDRGQGLLGHQKAFGFSSEWTLWLTSLSCSVDRFQWNHLCEAFSTVPMTEKFSIMVSNCPFVYYYCYLGFKYRMMWAHRRQLCSDQNWLFLRELNSQAWLPKYSILSPKKVPILYLHAYRGKSVLFKNWP